MINEGLIIFIIIVSWIFFFLIGLLVGLLKEKKDLKELWDLMNE